MPRRKQRSRRPASSPPPAADRGEGSLASAPPPWSFRAWWRSDQTRFVLAFIAVAGCLLTVYYLPRTSDDAVERWTAAYLRLYTRVVAWPIGVFDPHVSAHGNLLAGRFSMQIVKSCDAMEGNILFTSALLAFPAPWRRKAVALVVGLQALMGLNLVRLFVLYWVGVYAPSAFEFLHLDVWPLVMIASAAIDFVLCIRWMRAGQVESGEPEGLDAHAT
jgi:exosortase H (IPTLxxWG-CTERM-specific)